MGSEEMTRIYRTLSAKHENMGKEASDKFEESPWGEVFLFAMYERNEFWQEEFVGLAQMAKVDDTVLRKDVGNDAPIASSSHDLPPPRGPPRTAGGGAVRESGAGRGAGNPRKRQGGHRAREIDERGPYTCNRQRVGLCPGFQDGSCQSQRGQFRCPRDVNKSHQCSNCPCPNHGSGWCPNADHVPEMLAAIQRFNQRQQQGLGRGRKQGRANGRRP